MEVWHMSGAGNDFMVLDAREAALDYPALARTLCARTHADGFMAVERSEIADFCLRFYNSDGSRGEMCGNGSRCVCRFAYEHGIAPARMTVQTDAGLVSGERLDEACYRVRLMNPTAPPQPVSEGIDFVQVGVPHALVRVPALRWEDADALLPRARELRRDARFPHGANVDFYDLTGEGQARVLTFERGVEDYTLACGTGCASLAALLWTRGLLPGGTLVCENRGGTLRIDAAGADGAASSLLLTGDAILCGKYPL